jgi:hypothetical protein
MAIKKIISKITDFWSLGKSCDLTNKLFAVHITISFYKKKQKYTRLIRWLIILVVIKICVCTAKKLCIYTLSVMVYLNL